MRLLAAICISCILLVGALVWRLRSDSARLPRVSDARSIQPTTARSATNVGVEPEHAPASAPAISPKAPRPSAPEIAKDPQPAPTDSGYAKQFDSRTPVRWANDTRESERQSALARALATFQSNPTDPAPLLEFAQAAHAASDVAAVVDALTALVAARPDDDAARAGLSSALLQLGSWTLAARHLETLVERRPADARAWHNLALARQASGQISEARRAWTRVILLEPENADAHARRAELLIDLQLWNDAADDLDIAARRLPDEPALAMNQMYALDRAGRAAEALVVIDRFIARHPTHADALKRRARLLLRLASEAPERAEASSHRSAAAQSLRRLAALTPGDSEVAALLSEAERR